MQLHEIHICRVNAVTPDTALPEAAQQLMEQNLPELPVCEQGCLVGVVTAHDLIVRAVPSDGEPSGQPVREIMDHEPTYCYADQDVAEAAAVMETRGLGHLLVVDREQHLRGVLWLHDLLQTLFQSEPAAASSRRSSTSLADDEPTPPRTRRVRRS